MHEGVCVFGAGMGLDNVHSIGKSLELPIYFCDLLLYLFGCSLSGFSGLCSYSACE